MIADDFHKTKGLAPDHADGDRVDYWDDEPAGNGGIAEVVPTPLAERRGGLVRIADETMRYDYDVAQAIFAEIVPYKVEFDHCRASLEVYAYSRHFDPLDQGSVAPEYLVECNDADGEVRIRFIRVGGTA